MSKLSLMIFTLVLLTTILCNHSVHSRKRWLKADHKPWKCSFWGENFSKSDLQCLCWQKQDGEVMGRCRVTNRKTLYEVSIPL